MSTHPNGNVKRSDVLSILLLAGLLVLIYFTAQVNQVMVDHSSRSENIERQIAQSIKESARAQKIMTCILSLPQDKREEDFTKPDGFCQRMADMP